MKLICLLSSLFSVTIFSACLFAAEPMTYDLDGREVVVRVYNNWKEDPWTFETITVTIRDRTVDFEDANEKTVVVILADEQEDPNVKAALGDTVYAEPCKRGLTYTLGTYNPSVQNKLRTLVDGLGNPFSGATADIYLRCECAERYKVYLSRVVLENTNLLKVPIASGLLTTFEIILSHPDYGIAVAEIYKHDLANEVFVPILKPDSKEYESCIRGTVVDPDNIPVPRALLRSCALYPPGGGRLTCDRAYGVVTDEHGRFSMYLPLREGKLVPMNSEYEVSIAPHRDLELRGLGGTICSGQESTIVLRPRLPGHFHSFVFEDETGPITDVEKLKKIVVRVDSEHNSIKYIYSSWKNGRLLPTGTYRPTMKRSRKRLIFEPLVVTENSPEQLVFKAIYPWTVYDGRVVHGITGEPMPGVLVICAARRADGALLRAAKQWEAMLAIKDDFLADSDSPAPLPTTDDISKLTRTDEQGHFAVVYKQGKDNYLSTFSAFEEGYLIGRQKRPSLTADPAEYPNDHFDIPDIKLFPAATILLEPYAESMSNGPSVKADWRVTKEDDPAWQDALPSLGGGSWVSLNKACRMDIAAGFNVRVRLYVNESTEKSNPRWSPIVITGINLNQGQMLDLGRRTFESTFPIYVEVVNSRGEPIEGITVLHKCVSLLRKCWDNTDAEGIAVFSTTAHSRGEFTIFARKGELNVFGPNRHESALKQSITYEISGEEDANNVYTLQLSDEMLRRLFNED